MTPEDRLRQAMEARTSEVEPSADALSRIEEKLMDAQRSDNRKRVLIGLGAAAAAVALVLAAVAVTRDDDEPVSSDDPSSTTTSESTTTTEASTTTTTTFEGVDPDTPIYPDPTTSQRFSDPESAAAAFATFAGYTHPVLGEFQQGDNRSGEIQVRPSEAGPPTVVLLRQLEDDAWYVIGVTTDAIRLATPEPGATISSPQPLVGKAYAFEGNVVVRLFVDGVQEPVAQTNVTGRGDGVLGDFSGQLEFSNDTGATHGVLVLNGTSGEDGGATEVAAIRVRL
ncbi:MAG: Gmad2 immunoglobulin-like domain-containing protein [Acidimicrobiales bacterium]